MSGQRGVALEALRRYDVATAESHARGGVVQKHLPVTTASAVYAFRVGSALQIHPEGTSAVEAAWHRRLRQQGVCVPDVLANTDGELATLVTDGRAEHGSRTCVLFEWVAGRSLRTCMTGRRQLDALARAQSVVETRSGGARHTRRTWCTGT